MDVDENKALMEEYPIKEIEAFLEAKSVDFYKRKELSKDSSFLL